MGIKNNIQQILLYTVMVVVFIVILYLNRLYPLFADDWVYSCIFDSTFFDHSSERISSLYDIIISQYNHYFGWGGRSIVHSIDQFLLYINPIFCDLLNSLAYIFLIYLIYRLTNKNRAVNIGLFVFVACLVWVCVPQFTANVLWITGSANYLWGMLILLLFAYPYCTYFLNNKKSKNDSLIRIIMFFVAGIIAGWTNENTVPSLILILVVLGFYLYKRKMLPMWFIFGFIGLCIGYVILIIAPGNYIRMEFEMAGRESVLDNSLFETISYRFTNMFFSNYLKYMLPLLFIYILLYFFRRKYNYDSEDNNRLGKRKLLLSFFFFLAAHFSFIIMLGTPTFPLRAMFGIIIYMILAICFLYADIQLKTTLLKRLNVLFIVGLVVVYGFEFYRKYPSIYLVSSVFKEREAYLEKQKLLGIKDIEFIGKIRIHERYGFLDLESDTASWMNKEYAKFHGLNSVKVLDTP